MFVIDMTPMYRNQYNWGWITKETLANYVAMGIFTAKGYKDITGEDYKNEARDPQNVE